MKYFFSILKFSEILASKKKCIYIVDKYDESFNINLQPFFQDNFVKDKNEITQKIITGAKIFEQTNSSINFLDDFEIDVDKCTNLIQKYKILYLQSRFYENGSFLKQFKQIIRDICQNINESPSRNQNITQQSHLGLNILTGNLCMQLAQINKINSILIPSSCNKICRLYDLFMF